MGNRASFVFWMSVFLLCPALAGEEPGPAEREGSLRAEWADGHARLADWAKGKKLGRAARAHYRLALRLDPDCRSARLKLGHRRDDDGVWRPGREKEWEDGRGAGEKHGVELRRREADLLRREAAAFETLGLALLGEGEKERARRLLLRAHLLGPRREGAARGLGLAPFREGFAVPDLATELGRVPSAGDAPGLDFLGPALGVKTRIRACGAAVGETMNDADAAGELARTGHLAQLLTTRRFGLPPRGTGWITFCVADTGEQFERFLRGLAAFDEPFLAAMLRLGTARAFFPRHFGATWCGIGGDPKSAAPLFAHLAAEDVLFEAAGQEAPAWLHEAAGIDACLTLLGVPGPPCAVLEESAGLMTKEAFDDPETWVPLVVRAMAGGDFPRLPLLVRSQLQALGSEDLIASHLLYRYLLLTRRERLGAFLGLCGQGREAEECFREGLGTGPAELEEEIAGALLGGEDG